MSKAISFRTPYDGLSNQVSEATGLEFTKADYEGEFSAQQQFRDECDLNMIIAGQVNVDLDRFNERASRGAYLDLASLPDFTGAMNIVREAEAAFADLPAHVRKEFDNDPGQFLDFIETGDRAEFERLGLLVPPQAPQPTEDEQIESLATKVAKKIRPPTGDDTAS